MLRRQIALLTKVSHLASEISTQGESLSKQRSYDIVIIGAGIAGCSAAIALASAGHRVRVLEKQSAWKFQSSGIFIYSNGLAVLQDLGVLNEILDVGFSIPGGVNAYFDHTGHPIVETRYPEARNGVVPAIVGIKRAELQRVLAARMHGLGVPVTLGAEAECIEQSETDVCVNLTDGSELTADLVIGADGIHSWVRSQISPSMKPQYTGFGIWRSVHQRAPDLNQKIMLMGETKRYGIMPISAELLYTFGTVTHPKEKNIPPEEWVAQMREQLAEFSGPAAPFLAELGEQHEVFFTAVEEVVMPLPWHRGRVLLMGDACHAATPFMGQGGAMAMQDAVVFERALSSSENLHQALSKFGEARFPICRFVQDVSRAVGEAGANPGNDTLKERHAKFRDSAQASVDGFYAKLSNLSSQAETLF